MLWLDLHWQIQQALNPYLLAINVLIALGLATHLRLAFTRPAVAAATTLALLPTYLVRSSLFGIPFTLLEVLILATFAGWAWRKRNAGAAPANYLLPPEPYRRPAILVLLAATAGVFVSADTLAAAGLWKAYFLEPILLFAVLADVAKKNQGRESLLRGLALGTLPISLLAIVQKLNGFAIAEPSWIPEATRRVTSAFTSPNAVGLLLGPIVFILAGHALGRIKEAAPKAGTVGCLAAVALALGAMAFTVSHGTYLGLAAGAAWLLWQLPVQKKAKLVARVLLGLAGSLAVAYALTSPAARQVATLADPAGQGRLALWGVAVDHLTSSPANFALGAGLFGFPAIHEAARDPLVQEALLYPHNIFLNFWMELGLLGLAGFTWLFVVFFKKNSRADWLQLGVGAAAIALLVHGLVDVPYFKNDLAVLAWLTLALGLIPNHGSESPPAPGR